MKHLVNINGKQVELRFRYDDGGRLFGSWKEMVDFWAAGYGSRTYTDNLFKRTMKGGIYTANGIGIVSASHTGTVTKEEQKELMAKAVDFCKGMYGVENF